MLGEAQPPAASAAPTWSSGTSRRTAASTTAAHARGARGGAARGGRLPRHHLHRDGHRRGARPAARRWSASTSSRTPTCRAAGTRSAPRTSSVLRAAGIDVITTVNIQHLESLNDEVERITGVRQRETVPDEVVRTADQIQLVDMSPRRAAPPDGARQHLPGRADRRLAHVVLPGRQPDRAARARPALAGRPGRRRARRLPARAPASSSPGRPRSGSSSRSPAAPRARRCCAAAPGSPSAPPASELLAVHVIAHRRPAPTPTSAGSPRAQQLVDVARRHLPLRRRRGRRRRRSSTSRPAPTPR